MLHVSLSRSCSARYVHPTFAASTNQLLLQLCRIEDVEKEACFILGLLAIKPEHQLRIASADAISSLVGLLTKYINKPLPQVIPSSAHGVCRRASDAITNLAHENLDIKNMVRDKGGISPLVALLESVDIKVCCYCQYHVPASLPRLLLL
jgi:hypothetical protein